MVSKTPRRKADCRRRSASPAHPASVPRRGRACRGSRAARPAASVAGRRPRRRPRCGRPARRLERLHGPFRRQPLGAGVSSSSMNSGYSPRASRSAQLRAFDKPRRSSRTTRTATPRGARGARALRAWRPCSRCRSRAAPRAVREDADRRAFRACVRGGRRGCGVQCDRDEGRGAGPCSPASVTECRAGRGPGRRCSAAPPSGGRRCCPGVILRRNIAGCRCRTRRAGAGGSDRPQDG